MGEWAHETENVPNFMFIFVLLTSYVNSSFHYKYIRYMLIMVSKLHNYELNGIQCINIALVYILYITSFCSLHAVRSITPPIAL